MESRPAVYTDMIDWFSMRSMGLVAMLIVAFGVGYPTIAGADTIDTLIERLEESGDYKARISSALRLAKTQDRRAIQALVQVLEDTDGRRTLRRIAALSLGSMVGTSTSAALRKRVHRVLTHVAKSDRDRKIRRNATRALQQLQESPQRIDTVAQPAPRMAPSVKGKPRRGGVFVHIGMPRDRSRRPPRDIAPALRKTLRETLQSEAPRYRLDWPTGQPPTAAELSTAGVRGYHVRSAVMEYKVQRRGQRAEVQCAVSLQVNPWFGSDGEERWSERQAASANGRGRVTGGSDKRAIAMSKRECAQAVAEQIATEQVVPFLRRLERSAKK